MDTSETYMKQCEKAGEIQRIWDKSGIKWGDFYVYNDEPCSRDDPAYGFYGELQIKCVGKSETVEHNAFWLPRQDQLQEMVGMVGDPLFATYRLRLFSEGLKYVPDGAVYAHIDRSIDIQETEYPKQFTSMEQLWLAFVMQEKYNKVWDGENWLTTK
jgi:hypothetical protein